jgi:hypothetical protein
MISKLNHFHRVWSIVLLIQNEFSQHAEVALRLLMKL